MHDPIPFEIKLEHITLSGLRWGKEHSTEHQPPVLALHGWLDNSASFCRIAPILASECNLDIWAIDLVGHGLSSHRPAGSFYHIWDNVIDISLLMAAQGWERVDLLGHSMGAGIATLMAGAMPEKVVHLALLEGIGPIVTEAEAAPHQLSQSTSAYQLLPYKKATPYDSFESAVAARCNGFAKISTAAALPLSERGLRQIDNHWYWNADPRLKIPSPVRFTETQVEAFCSQIQATTCLLTADAGFLTDRQNTQTRAARVTHLSHNILPGNHHFHLEPDTANNVAEALVSFWQTSNQVVA